MNCEISIKILLMEMLKQQKSHNVKGLQILSRSANTIKQNIKEKRLKEDCVCMCFLIKIRIYNKFLFSFSFINKNAQ